MCSSQNTKLYNINLILNCKTCQGTGRFHPVPWFHPKFWFQATRLDVGLVPGNHQAEYSHFIFIFRAYIPYGFIQLYVDKVFEPVDTSGILLL
jgi:hypothetical protein